LAFDWDPLTTRWEEGFKHLQEFVKKHKHCRVPKEYKSSDGFKLGEWVLEERHKPDTLTHERKARLDAIGFDWDPYATQWEEGFKHLEEFAKTNKHCRVPHAYQSADGFRLGGWVLKQRQNRESLLVGQIKRLDSLGFDWDPRTTKWEVGFEHLQEFVKENKHCRVPYKYKSPDGYLLGQWVDTQRQFRRKGELSAERLARLDALGFVWRVMLQELR
jgi:hypothetical protein